MSPVLLSVALTGLGVVGLAVGSFLNVVIYRVPQGLSLMRPGSACPGCAAPIRAFDNIPVLSWLVLRGRCRDCHTPISPRYPAIELVTAALFVLVGVRFGWDGYTPAVLALVAGGVALFMIDLDRRRLPFAITGVVTVLVVVALAADVLVGSTAFRPVALISVGIWLGVYGGVWLGTSGRGMGLGDVALAPLLGLALGWQGWGPTLVGLIGGFVIGAVVGVGLMLGGRAGRRTRVPHGPFMLAGAAVGVFLGEPLWTGYLELAGVA
jgi:leader peptidase (prepilin peptidase)/N-methyltransferase